MNKKTLLVGSFLIGLLSMTFAIPAAAQDIPTWALTEGDVEGWYLAWELHQGSTYIPELDITIEMWFQIWMNAPNWTSTTKAIAILVEDLGTDKICIMGYCVSLASGMDLTAEFLNLTKVNVPGWTKSYEGEYGGIHVGLGYKKPGILVSFVAVSINTTPTGLPVWSKTPAMKDPSISNVNAQDIETLMSGLGGKLPGIPGFTLLPLLLGLTTILTIAILIKRTPAKVV